MSKPLTVATALVGTRYRNPKGVLLVYVGPSKSAPGLYDVRVEETGRVIVAPPTQQLFEIDAAELAGIEIAPLRNQPRDVVASALAALSDAALEALADGDTRPFVQTLCTAEFARREAIHPVKPAITVIAQGDIEIEEIDLVPVKPIADAVAEIEGETICDPGARSSADTAAAQPVVREIDRVAAEVARINAGDTHTATYDAATSTITSTQNPPPGSSFTEIEGDKSLATVKRPRKTPEEKAEAARLKALKAELKGGTITGEKLGPEIVESFVTDPVVASIEAALTEAHADPVAPRTHARRYVAEADTENGTPTGVWYVADEALRGDIVGEPWLSADPAANERAARAEADRLEAACCIDAASDLCEADASWLEILDAVEAAIVVRPDLNGILERAANALHDATEGAPVTDAGMIEGALAHARALLRPPISEERATIEHTTVRVQMPVTIAPEAEDLRFLAQRNVILADGDLALFRGLVGSVRENSVALVGCRNEALVDAALAWEMDHAARETAARKLADRLASIRGGKRPADASGTRTLREHGPVTHPHGATPVTPTPGPVLSDEGRAAVETAQARLRAQAAALLVLADALPGYRAAIEAEAVLDALGIPNALPR